MILLSAHELKTPLMALIKSILFYTSVWLALSGCTTNLSLGLPITNGNYVPDVNLKGDDRLRYEQDVAICQKQILKQYGDNYGSNNAVTDLRRCLIEKGYVLLS